MAKSQPLLVFGDDNGSCSLYKLTLEQYEGLRDKLNEAETDDEEQKYLDAIDSFKIDIDFGDAGYVPDYVVKLAEIYGFDYDSN